MIYICFSIVSVRRTQWWSLLFIFGKVPKLAKPISAVISRIIPFCPYFAVNRLIMLEFNLVIKSICMFIVLFCIELSMRVVHCIAAVVNLQLKESSACEMYRRLS